MKGTLCLISGLLLISTAIRAQNSRFPQQNAVNVNPDTHLVLKFDSTPTIGNKGFIRVFEEGTNKQVDCLDLSIPAGPTTGQSNVGAIYSPVPYEYKATNYTNANTIPRTFPSRRAAFTSDNGFGIALENLTIQTDLKGQAEGLLMMGEGNSLKNIHVIGSGDALLINGGTYLENCIIDGDGDTVLGRGPAFFQDCTLSSYGAFMWIRNTNQNHGNIFVNCTFIGKGKDALIARSPVNKGQGYPYAEAVLIN